MNYRIMGIDWVNKRTIWLTKPANLGRHWTMEPNYSAAHTVHSYAAAKTMCRIAMQITASEDVPIYIDVDDGHSLDS